MQWYLASGLSEVVFHPSQRVSGASPDWPGDLPASNNQVPPLRRKKSGFNLNLVHTSEQSTYPPPWISRCCSAFPERAIFFLIIRRPRFRMRRWLEAGNLELGSGGLGPRV